MNTAEVHTIEHLDANFLRNHPVYKDKTVYFGPMGCRTGFYLLLAGDLSSKDIVPLMIEMFEFIRDYEGEVPGASPRDCGNYLDMNLGMANYLAKRYLEQVLYSCLLYTSRHCFKKKVFFGFASPRAAHLIAKHLTVQEIPTEFPTQLKSPGNQFPGLAYVRSQMRFYASVHAFLLPSRLYCRFWNFTKSAIPLKN